MTSNVTRNFALAVLAGLAFASTSLSAQSAGWDKQVSNLVAANFSYPRSAVVRGDEGKALIRVNVAPNGSITSVTLAKSTGSPILDREAVRIVQKIARFPAPPAGTNSVSLPIIFQIK